ncbi:MAG TPA: response regulator [Polyangia bacterium]|jgi:two-component system OmpR family response regulator|nr:response regulator [Polyangia bacterium]
MKRDRLLVVEDDPATLASIRDLLLRAGFEVETATTGRDALARLLDEELPAAIILDARMPVMSGAEFASVVRGYWRFANIPILLLTAWDTPATVVNSVDAVMRKPFRADELLARVEMLVTSPAAIG